MHTDKSSILIGVVWLCDWYAESQKSLRSGNIDPERAPQMCGHCSWLEIPHTFCWPDFLDFNQSSSPPYVKQLFSPPLMASSLTTSNSFLPHQLASSDPKHTMADLFRTFTCSISTNQHELTVLEADINSARPRRRVWGEVRLAKGRAWLR